MIEITIDKLGINLANYQQVVILKEKTAERYLPIWIGHTEARAITIKLEGVDVPRPLSHDLLCSVINALGASVDYVIINALQDDVFYAKIVLNLGGQRLEIDFRPSDTLALAVRAEVPIFADEVVLTHAGILLDEETGELIPQSGESKTTSYEDLRRMSAFIDFVNTLDLQDFNKQESK